MDQTPINLGVNGNLLALIPPDASRIVEVGCSGGGLAREYRKINPRCEYIGIEINEEYAEVARAHCTRVLVDDIEHMSDAVFASIASCSCWIFGDVLEHLHDPWALLRRIRSTIPPQSSVLACIPNAQHWTLQARLTCGAGRYY
jgi:2-polyprenyl-3-methyl-5-hydroxy-6-metoxy-1,4-benzoquinol methylase